MKMMVVVIVTMMVVVVSSVFTEYLPCASHWAK